MTDRTSPTGISSTTRIAKSIPISSKDEGSQQQQRVQRTCSGGSSCNATTTTTTTTTGTATRRRRKKIHPLQMPRRVSPISGLVICRYHNYFENGCKRYNDPKSHCPLDHQTCHICLQTMATTTICTTTTTTTTTQKTKTNNHCRALDCPIYHDDDLFLTFQETFTLKNTRPEGYPVTKTVLGHPVVWIETLGVPSIVPLNSIDNEAIKTATNPEGGNETKNDEKNKDIVSDDTHAFRIGHDDQLLRCRKLKRFEASLISKLAPGSRIVDVGGHFGDTTITLALYAKDMFSSRSSSKKKKLQFFCLEPNPGKCDWIRKVVVANDLVDTVHVLCVAVGDTCQTVIPMIEYNKTDDDGDGDDDDNDVDDDGDKTTSKTKKKSKDIADAHRQLYNGSLMYEPLLNEENVNEENGDDEETVKGNQIINLHGDNNGDDDDGNGTINNNINNNSEKNTNTRQTRTETFRKKSSIANAGNGLYRHQQNKEQGHGIPMITLDSIFDQLYPVGLLHIDVEGWESRVLQGARRLLSESSSSSNSTSSHPCYVIAEAWTEKECRRRGIHQSSTKSSSTKSSSSSSSSSPNRNPEIEIVQIMNQYHPNFVRQDDIFDIERNLVYCSP